MVKPPPDLWTLAFGRPQIDPHDLAAAAEELACKSDLDYRSRLLIRDSVQALRGYWGDARVDRWLAKLPVHSEIAEIEAYEFDKIGFPSLRKRLMDKLLPKTIRQYFQDLGKSVRKRTHIDIAGAVALILPGYVERSTGDIDVVGEVPEEIRNNHSLLENLEAEHGLQLGHVQTHYFPSGWSERVHAFEIYDQLEVSLVDVYDVFLSKLFSARLKDRSDLNLLVPQLDKETILVKLRSTCSGFLGLPRLRGLAADNWKFIFLEDFPAS